MPSGCIILDDRTFFTRLGRLEYVVIAVAFSVLSYYKSIADFTEQPPSTAIILLSVSIIGRLVFFPLAKL